MRIDWVIRPGPYPGLPEFDSLIRIQKENMKNIGTCSKCRFSKKSYQYLTVFKCKHEKMVKSCNLKTDEDLPADGIVVEAGDDRDWGFCVGPDFGCIHWEEKV